MAASGIGSRYRHATFEEVKRRGIPPEMERVFRWARKYSDTFSERCREGKGLLLSGPPGTLKTTAAVCAAVEIARKGYGILFIAMAEFLDQYMAMVRRGRGEETADFEEKIRSARLLIADDLGAEGESDWSRAKIDALMAARYDRRLPMIITTNLTAGGLRARYNDRVYDRIKEMSYTMFTTGKSLREGPE